MTNHSQRPSHTPSIGVIILAAGRSSRMGRPKLLLPWLHTTVLGHLIDQWQQLGAAHIAVVCAAGDSLVSGELDRLGFPAEDRIVNPLPEKGMFSSIQCAAKWEGWRTGLTHWVVVLGDQPHLHTATLRQLLETSATAPDKVCQPARQRRPKHPVILPKAVFKALSVRSVQHLKEFLAAWPTATFDCDDPGLDLDLDQPADYRRAKALRTAK